MSAWVGELVTRAVSELDGLELARRQALQALAQPVRPPLDAPGRAAISVEVMQELHVNLVRKAGLATGDAATLVSRYLAWPVVDKTARCWRGPGMCRRAGHWVFGTA